MKLYIYNNNNARTRTYIRLPLKWKCYIFYCRRAFVPPDFLKPQSLNPNTWGVFSAHKQPSQASEAAFSGEFLGTTASKPPSRAPGRPLYNNK